MVIWSAGRDLDLRVCAANSSKEVAGQLEPAAALEDEVQHDSEGSHRQDSEWVTQFPAESGMCLKFMP
jgi:hypothetical protein